MKARTQFNRRNVEALKCQSVEAVRTPFFTDVPARAERPERFPATVIAPLNAARTAQRAVPATLQRFNASTLQRSAFTLIELLVVIAVIAVLAALLIPAGASVVRHAQIQRAQSELGVLETAIQSYYSKYGFYPPGNAHSGIYITNQLYYELLGTTNIGTGFTTLDGASTILTPAMPTFGVQAFMNCDTGSNSVEDSVPAKDFLSGLKPSEIATNANNGNPYSMIVTSANSDAGYQPLPGVYSLTGRAANPWRYRYPGSNNPTSYDLWIQVYVGGKTNLICNWAKQPQYNVAIQGQ